MRHNSVPYRADKGKGPIEAIHGRKECRDLKRVSARHGERAVLNKQTDRDLTETVHGRKWCRALKSVVHGMNNVPPTTNSRQENAPYTGSPRQDPRAINR